MKHLFLFCCVNALCGLVTAQITVTNETFPRPGDTLFIAIDNVPSGINVGMPGGDQRWDFTTLQSPFSRRTIVKSATEGTFSTSFPDAEVLISLAENTENYYSVTSDRFELIGFAGVDPAGLGIEALTGFDPPIIERRATMNYFDNNQMEAALSYAVATDDLPAQLLDQLPIRPDSLRLRVTISRTDEVDAWGRLTIPGGIYDVLREKRREVRDVRLDAKLGFLPWTDITDIALQALSIDELGENIVVRYHYFSNESKEPIAVVTMAADEQTVINVEYKSNDVVTNVQNINSLRPGVYAFPNPAIVNVKFEFSNLPKGKYTIKIYNIIGREVWRKDYEINGHRTEKVDISMLRKGTYLYSLINEEGKTITTHRLVVIRP